METINDLTTLDISTETERTYHYPGVEFTVTEPKSLAVAMSSNGMDAHHIITKSGRGIYIKPGWLAVSWAVTEGSPIFSF